MADPTPPTGQGAPVAGSTVVVPEDLRQKHSDLIDLILKSESMNDEERQYWINILPVMTPDQQGNLRTILQNERDQLAAIDVKYARDVAKAGPSVEEIEHQRAEKRAMRSSDQKVHEEEERKLEAEILAAIEASGGG